MAKKDDIGERTIDLIIIFGIIYFWYYILDVLFKLVELQIKAVLSIILSLITFKLIGRKILKYLT